ncbi:MAG TPA: hypothetical protein VJB12_03700 [Candidatus Nanoarchaeia archaeon]|nr:hypothetical protein [Candidatus Nanoarchaeia archaeon]
MKFNVTTIQKSKNDEQRGLILPIEPSEELAEFLGILTGDGYMNHYPYQGKYLIEIAGDSRSDKEYFVEVSNLISTLFGLKPTVRYLKGQNTMNLRMMSKGMFNFLLLCGFKRGRKEQIGIPLWIKEEERYMNAFLRGLADTDFSFHWRRDYPIISGGLKSQVLMVAVAEYLRSKGFAVAGPYKETTKDLRGYKDSVKYRMALNGHKNLERWMGSIGFRNKRHLRKIDGDGEI